MQGGPGSCCSPDLVLGLSLGFGFGFAGLGASAAPTCTFLQPVGGNGTSPIVSKSVGRGKMIGKTNWNTDFFITQPYTSYKFFFTANSSDAKAQYPVEGYMKFSDGSNLQLFNMYAACSTSQAITGFKRDDQPLDSDTVP